MLEYSWGRVVAANHSIYRVMWHSDVVLTYLDGELYNIKEQPNSKQNIDDDDANTFDRQLNSAHSLKLFYFISWWNHAWNKIILEWSTDGSVSGLK